MQTAEVSKIKSEKAAIRQYKRNSKKQIRYIEYRINDAVRNGYGYLYLNTSLYNSTEKWLKELGYSVKHIVGLIKISWNDEE